MTTPATSARGPRSVPLWICLLASLFLHAAVALLFVQRSWSPPTPDERADALEQERDLDRPRLGIERSPAATLTWIGFDVPAPHAAPLSEVEQPELNRGPLPSNDPNLQPERPRPVPVADRARMAAARAQAALAATARQMLDGLETAQSLVALLAQANASEARPPAEETPQPEAAAAAASADDSPKEDQEPPTTTTTAGGAQQDSDATATVAVEQSALGRPVAAEGLRIFTTRPAFSQYTRIRSRPRNPVVRIHFDRRGRVTLVEVTRSSGYPDVDEPVLTAAYNWTAEGEALRELPASDPEATLAIDFQILL